MDGFLRYRTPSSVREMLDRHEPAFAINPPGRFQQLDVVGPRSLQGSAQQDDCYPLWDVCSRRVALKVGTKHQAITIVKALIRSWQRMGRPTSFQHDHALAFRGRHRYPHSAGLLPNLCLALGGESVLIPSHQPHVNIGQQLNRPLPHADTYRMRPDNRNNNLGFRLVSPRFARGYGLRIVLACTRLCPGHWRGVIPKEGPVSY